VMTLFVKDFEYSDPKTAVSINVYRCVAVAKVKSTQCLCGL
jgi:hypothetical protein